MYRDLHAAAKKFEKFNRLAAAVLAIVAAFALLGSFEASAQAADTSPAKRPNILIISIDDLNDWTGCLAGHPQARTPHIDNLAARGTLFRNAHCQAPICTPSRASLVTGLYPHTTGLYFLQPRLEASEVAMRRPHLLRHFAEAGYHTMGAGKFVHGGNEERHYEEAGGSMGGFGPVPEQKLTEAPGLQLWDWGPFPEDENEMPDTKVADWVIERLGQKQDRPFLLVAGFWRPHVPMFAPPRWFEPFPLDKIQLPLTRDDDRNDLSEYAMALTIGLPAPRHEWFVEHNQWQSAVQAYLASVAFVDHCVGRVMEALDKSPYADNTIVVLLSDHGWHLGEKQRWAKRSLWNDSTHVPLIVALPAKLQSEKSSRECNQPVGLIDVFPTLLDLAGLPPREDLEGRSMRPLLDNPQATWDRPILTTFAPANHSLRDEHFHYIRYGDGSEELYDLRRDPHEWDNLAFPKLTPEHAAVIERLRAHLPQCEAEPVLSDWQNWEIEAWRAAEALKKPQ